ncbi:MAG: DNA mismatch repair endonuclease MutL, partial [Clostridia bacterium]|nr:DNA mismatch repair endonuclease MutL [Clostridia bacterium]
MGKINLLPTQISDKIAAGEVVERPSSVVKELVENAIDAGATILDIEIKKGGITYIRVTDNGVGMSREDAKIAFFRHATSKIKTEADLDAIYTLGFRGEALSSIGAVSQTELITKRAEDEVGTLVRISGGVIEECTDVGVPDGTTMAVNNLFYNTPARMNFLKKDATEAAAVTDIVERFILSHPEISFRYTVDGKEKYFTNGDNNLISSIYAVYGKNYTSSVILVDEETSFGRIHGAIGKGDAARPNRNYQSFFVNKRYIKSLRMSATLGNAYKNQIMIGKYPMA